MKAPGKIQAVELHAHSPSGGFIIYERYCQTRWELFKAFLFFWRKL